MRIGRAVDESVDRPPGDLNDCRSRNGMDCMATGCQWPRDQLFG